MGGDGLEPNETRGVVVRLHRLGCTVEHAGGSSECKRVKGADLCVGDEVALALPDGGRPAIARRLPRRTWFARSVEGGRRSKLLAANAGVLAVVASADEPPPEPGLIDRFLVLAHAGRMDACLCMNKMDLADAAAVDALLAPYDALGMPVFRVCALTGDGVEAVADWARGQHVLFCGHSGVGKSTLINGLVGDHARLRTGDISSATGKGRHTTTWVDWIPLANDTVVIDTPGIRQLSLLGVEPETIRTAFVEFAPHAEHCRYADCRHDAEPDCAVRAAAARGDIDPGRYARYGAILRNP